MRLDFKRASDRKKEQMTEMEGATMKLYKNLRKY